MRHVRMTCTGWPCHQSAQRLPALRRRLLRLLESALLSSPAGHEVVEEGYKWHAEHSQGRSDHVGSAAVEFPALAAWRFYVPTADEPQLQADHDAGTPNPLSQETATDVAYRGLVPKGMGQLLDRHEASVSGADPASAGQTGVASQ